MRSVEARRRPGTRGRRRAPREVQHAWPAAPGLRSQNAIANAPLPAADVEQRAGLAQRPAGRRACGPLQRAGVLGRGERARLVRARPAARRACRTRRRCPRSRVQVHERRVDLPPDLQPEVLAEVRARAADEVPLAGRRVARTRRRPGRAGRAPASARSSVRSRLRGHARAGRQLGGRSARPVGEQREQVDLAARRTAPWTP